MWTGAIALLALISSVESISCYTGSRDNKELTPCSLVGTYTADNGTTVNYNAEIPCCKREVRGPMIKLICAGPKDRCPSDKCYDKREESSSTDSCVRSFDCFCSGEGCNAAGMAAATFGLAVLAPLALVYAGL